MPPTAPNRLNPNPELGAALQSLIVRAERALDRSLPPAEQSPAELHRAMRYAVLGGGKRLRPLLYAGDDLVAVADRWIDARGTAIFRQADAWPHWRAGR